MTAKEREGMDVVTYRLDKIDETLSSMKDVMLQVSRVGDRIAQLDEKLETHIKHSADVLHDYEKRIEKQETRPLEEQSARWRYVIDYAFKGIVAAAMGWLFIKIGIR